MSQQYGPQGGGQPPQYGQNPGGPQGQPPQYGQPSGQPGTPPVNTQGGQPGSNPAQQPTQYVPGPYGAPPPPSYPQPGQQGTQPQPPYGQPQPPYGQPGGYQPTPYPAPPAPSPLKAIKEPARQVTADGFERSLTLVVYLLSTLAAAGFLGLGDTPLALRSAGSNGFYAVSFGLSLGYLVVFALPLAVIYGVTTGELVKFHAKQALWLLIAYTVIRLVIELFFLIPSQGVQDVLFNGIIVGALHVIVVLAGAFAGVRAFMNREMYSLPVIGSFVK